MTLLKTLMTVCSAALVLTPAVAQSRFCIGGDLDHLTTAQRSTCASTLQKVRAAAVAAHAPEDWHFILVCGEDGWRQYSAFSLSGEHSLDGLMASTNVRERETYLRERDLEQGDARSVSSIIAREIAIEQARNN